MSHESYMNRAIELAQIAAQQGEVPIGAVVVHNGEIVGEGYNQTITTLDPSAHAEMVAIRQAAAELGNYRLVDCTLYVTIEPCTMCVGLLVHSRIDTLVFGATEQKAGAICSATKVDQQVHFNHKFDVISGILAEQCADAMSQFFQMRRDKKKALKRKSPPTV